MDSKLLLNDMKELKGIFNHIATNLCEFNDICKKMIEGCFDETNEEKLEERKKSILKKIKKIKIFYKNYQVLAQKMDDLLYLDQGTLENLQDIDNENLLTLEMLTLKDHEDWVIVKEKSLKEENLDNGFIKYDLEKDG